ncbi:MAG: DUF4124 domain-containing protein [Gammaproteobacteria bacterium]|uniref:DUF4124 domain-containing protein n=1 Tax=Pseudomaricurvus alcaniphilus TaxID=1166482 RepID=UPI00140CED85|nr:DUF4124 domain-containing protein [Pseudomaricurvus alcaniphilus]MBR9910472.1 DUF4124 domain-containing protein [Gammaproteobacteria bacterium]NHN39729.1 DUF4124 domain-containing protein [Pseudomaricurvus alcaniphilus]
MIARVLRRGMPLAISAALLISWGQQASSKEYYRWQDDEGITHYSAHPPKDRVATKVRATNTQIEVRDNQAPPAPAQNADQDSEAAPDNAQQTAAAKPVSDPQRCEAARKNIKTLQEKSRIRIKDNGEYRFLTPEEMAEKLRIAQHIIDEEC